MRFYLLTSLFLSLVLPFITISIDWHTNLISAESIPNVLLAQAKRTITEVATNNPNSIQLNSGISLFQIILYSVFACYLIGVIYNSFIFAKNLINIYGFIKKSTKVKEENYWIINLNHNIPAFSFFNYIFINHNYKSLSTTDLQIIKNHEIIHVKQNHTLDVIFIELIGILFWFNPIMNYLKKSLKEIHEYIVDERIAGNTKNKKAYAQLLLNLATETQVFNLATNFTGEQVKRRILMIAKQRSSQKNKLRFIILLPLTAILLITFSCVKNPHTNAKTEPEVKIENKDWSNKSPFALQLDLKKYCGKYGPMVTDTMLRPMEIVNIDNRLFRYIESESSGANRTIELQFQSTNKYIYTDYSSRSIEFILNSDNQVTGCILTRKDGTYKLFKENC